MRVTLLSFIIALSLTFLGISTNLQACPDGQKAVANPAPQCVEPGPPGGKDREIPAIADFQLECLSTSNFTAHAAPVPGSKNCQAPLQFWECCGLGDDRQ